MSLLQLKDDAVALVDVFAPPDFILNSPIGNADGQVKTCERLKPNYTPEKTFLDLQIFVNQLNRKENTFALWMTIKQAYNK